MDFSIADNMIIKDYTNEPFAKNGVLNYKNIKSSARKLIKNTTSRRPTRMSACATSPAATSRRVVIARELDPEPVLDIAAHPTAVWTWAQWSTSTTFFSKERNRGAAVLFISAELQEVMALSDRIIVLYSGQIMGDLDGETADQKCDRSDDAGSEC